MEHRIRNRQTHIVNVLFRMWQNNLMGKGNFSINYLGQLDTHMKNNELYFISPTYTKINSKLIRQCIYDLG